MPPSTDIGRLRVSAPWTSPSCSQARVNLSESLSQVSMARPRAWKSFSLGTPMTGFPWDHSSGLEVERRLARLRWVEHEQEKERRGGRGVWNWPVGKEQLPGEMLFDEMIEHADGMLAR